MLFFPITVHPIKNCPSIKLPLFFNSKQTIAFLTHQLKKLAEIHSRMQQIDA